MFVLAAVFAVLAAALHGYIFVLESLRWEQPATRRTFGTTPDTAATTREMAYNQGFYNLFLAIVTVVGLVLAALGKTEAGYALVFAGTGSMLAAALVLGLSSVKRLRIALIQGSTPLLAVLFLALEILL